MQEPVRQTTTPGLSGLWRDAQELPASLAATLDAADGFDEVADLLSSPTVRRVVVIGNGASHYVGVNLWLSSLTAGGAHPHAEVVAVPAGLVATGSFEWRPGDALLAISSSGEFKDVVEAVLNAPGAQPCAAVTASPDSTIGARADARALVSMVQQRAVTHTQAFCGAVAAAMAVWARVTRDRALESSLQRAVDGMAQSLMRADAWVDEHLARVPTPRAGVAFASGPATAAALETALLMREVACLPWEGAETREGATTAMYALGPGDVVLALGAPSRAAAETEQACARTGATVLRLPAAAEEDPRVTAIASFPFALAGALLLGHREGIDVDRPHWVDGYHATARRRPLDAERRAQPPDPTPQPGGSRDARP